MDVPTLTEKQAKILQLIAAIREAAGFTPTYQQLADWLDVTRTTIAEHIERLESKEYLTRERDKARSISLTESSWTWYHSLPYCPNIHHICGEIITKHCDSTID